MAETKTSQESVIDFLSQRENHGGMPVRRIDTHAAIVFLAGERAIKIKRAVRFPYLDFSTLEKRKAACEAELRVNRTFAPALYRRVVAITQDGDGRLGIGGQGIPVEWAVEMYRFDEAQTLDHLADAGRIDVHLADALGRMVVDAHTRATVTQDFNFIAALDKIIAQNEAELLAVPNLFLPEAVRTLTEQMRSALNSAQKLLQERERNGFVRRCHGDLHLANIVLIEEKPMLFDAIEFDEHTATSDTLYDLAFLLMDLLARDLQAAANIVLNRYLSETRRLIDLDGLAALALFMAVRAAIRAKVKAAQGIHSDSPEHNFREAQSYFALAKRLMEPAAPRLIAIGGLSGTGKSALGRALAPFIAPAPGAIILRSDVERKALFGVAEAEELPSEAYGYEVSKKVYTALMAKACRIIAAGHSVIVDAVFADPAERAQILAVAGKAHFYGLFLTAPLATRLARVGARTHDVSDADEAVARAQESYVLGSIDWSIIDASGTPETTMRKADRILRAAGINNMRF